MSRQKKITLILICILATVFLLQIMLVPNRNVGITNLSMMAWLLTIMGCIASAQKGLRVFITVVGLITIGIPFAFLLAMTLSRPGSSLVVTCFLAAWTLISGILARRPKSVYWTLHLATWIFGVGLVLFFSILPPYHNFYVPYWTWLLLPAGISLALGAQYQTVLAYLSRFPFLKTEPAPLPALPDQPPSSYQQGYQAEQRQDHIYQEGGQIFTYSPQEQPQAQYPHTTVRH